MSRILKEMKGNPLALWLRCEIRLVSYFIPVLNYIFSPEKAVIILKPRRQYLPLQSTFPADLVCYLGSLLKKTLFMHDKYCIRHSYLLYRYLRLYSFPAIINFGLKGDNRKEGHCWVTLYDNVFYDETHPDSEYVILVGNSGNIQYWI